MKKQYSVLEYQGIFTPQYRVYTTMFFSNEYGSWHYFNSKGDDVWLCDEDFKDAMISFDNLIEANQFLKEMKSRHVKIDATDKERERIKKKDAKYHYL